MSDFEDLIKVALRDAHADDPEGETATNRAVDFFLRQSRWVAGFAWMKMAATLLISTVSGGLFFVVDSLQAQLAYASLFIVGFVGFGMWWTWYWQVLNRNAALREIKRLELQIAELRAAGS